MDKVSAANVSIHDSIRQQVLGGQARNQPVAQPHRPASVTPQSLVEIQNGRPLRTGVGINQVLSELRNAVMKR